MKLEQRIRYINALAHKHAKGEDKQEQYLVVIGRHIAAIKAEHPDDWQSIVEERCQIGRSRSYELIQIGAGTKTVERLRLEGAKRVREHEARKVANRPLANRQPESVPDGQKATEPEPTPTPTAGNGADPEASAESMKAQFAALDAGDGESTAGDGNGAEPPWTDDDSYYPDLPRWTAAEQDKAAELVRAIPRLWELARAFKGREECDADEEENATRIVASIPDRDLRAAIDAIRGLEHFYVLMRIASDRDPRCIPDAADLAVIDERYEPLPGRKNTRRHWRAEQEREQEARDLRLERLAQTEPAAG